MKVGRMRYRIEIQKLIVTTDPDGFTSEGWTTIHRVWADITPVSGREFLSSGQETTEITSKIYIRILADLNSAMRICTGNRIFDIESILTDERAGLMTIMAKEVK